MIICPQARVLYLNPPRTGSSLILRELRRRQRRVIRPRDGCAGHQTEWEDRFAGFFVFQSVRHPFPRAVSIWRRLVENMQHRDAHWRAYLEDGEISFQGLLDHEHEEIQGYWRWMRCRHFAERAGHVDKVVYLETLHRDLAGVPLLSDWRPTQVINPKQDERPWQAYYTPQARRRVCELFADDFQAYGYTQDLSACCRGQYFAP